MIWNIVIWSAMALVIAIVAPPTIRDVVELWKEYMPKRKDSHKASLSSQPNLTIQTPD